MLKLSIFYLTTSIKLIADDDERQCIQSIKKRYLLLPRIQSLQIANQSSHHCRIKLRRNLLIKGDLSNNPEIPKLLPLQNKSKENNKQNATNIRCMQQIIRISFDFYSAQSKNTNHRSCKRSVLSTFCFYRSKTILPWLQSGR